MSDAGDDARDGTRGPDEAENGQSGPDTTEDGQPAPEGTDAADGGSGRADDVESLRAAVEDEYDFDEFGPADMAQMSIDEWQAAFDPETWITGEDLIDRVEADLKTRVANREVFARVERYEDPPRLLAYSESSYAMVYPDGSVDGEGTVMRDVKPTVALSSMESYDAPEKPEGSVLPTPDEVPEGGSELGNNVLQVVAGILVVAALVLFGGGVLSFGTAGANALVMFVAGVAFLAIGLVLFVVVANARLSDTFRAEEFRDRLRGVGLADGERPEFLPPPPDESPEVDGAGNRSAEATATATESEADRDGSTEGNGRPTMDDADATIDDPDEGTTTGGDGRPDRS